MAYGQVPAVAGVLYGIKPAVTAIVLVAGLWGYGGGRWAPAQFSTDVSHGALANVDRVSVIGNDTPTPAHAVFSWGRFVTVLLVGFGLWVVAIAALAMVYG